MSGFAKFGGAAMTSNRDDWETPKELFEQLDLEFHFDLDAASSDANAKCRMHYTAEQNGLSQDWSGHRVFCNPPYGRAISKWVKKCSEEAEKPGTLVVMLIPARTDTSYFHDYVLHRASEIRFIRGRLKFELGGVPRQSAPFPSMIVVFDRKVDA